jgi:hypothetical protein
MRLEGGCYCGAVRYVAEGELAYTKGAARRRPTRGPIKLTP